MATRSPLKKICLHCSEEKRKSFQSKNFARHLKQEHNAVYNKLCGDGRHKMNHPEFGTDFTWDNANNENNNDGSVPQQNEQEN